MHKRHIMMRCLALTLAAILLLAGCSSSERSPATAQPTAPAAAQTEAPADPESSSAQEPGAEPTDTPEANPTPAPDAGGDEVVAGGGAAGEDETVAGGGAGDNDDIVVGGGEESMPDYGPYDVPKLEQTISEIPFNTEEPGTGLEISIDRVIGNCVLLKLTNNTDVCYDMVGYHLYPLSDPRLGLYAYFAFVPGHCTVYDIQPMSTERVQSDKFEHPTDVVVYNDWSKDMGIEIDNYTVSDVLLMDATPYLQIEYLEGDPEGRLAVFRNATDKTIHVRSFVILDGSEVTRTEYMMYLDGVLAGSRFDDRFHNGGTIVTEAEIYFAEPYSAGNPLALFCGSELLAPQAINGLTDAEIQAGDYYTVDPSQYSSMEVFLASAHFSWAEGY